MREQLVMVYDFVLDDVHVGIRVSDGLVAVTKATENSADSLHEYLRTRRGGERSRFRYEDATWLESGQASLMVAQHCNLRCWYCYGGGNGEYGAAGMLKKAAAFSAIDAILQAPSDRAVVNFFGGEPLLVWRLITDCADHASARAEALGKAVAFTMTTNAVLVDEAKALWLAQQGFSITVSIDGTQADHDRNRPTARGEGSWNQVIAGAKLLLRHLGPERVHARATLSSGHAPYSEIVHSLSEVGFKEIYLSAVEVAPGGSGGFSPTEWMQQDERAWETADAYTDRHVLGEQTLAADPIRMYVDMLIRSTGLDRACGVGGTASAIGADGKVYPCHRFVGDQRFAISRRPEDAVAATAHRTRFVELLERVNDDCSACFAWRFCGGGCSHEALQRLDAGQPPHDERECEAIRSHVRAALSVLTRRIPTSRLDRPRKLDVALLGGDVEGALLDRAFGRVGN